VTRGGFKKNSQPITEVSRPFSSAGAAPIDLGSKDAAMLPNLPAGGWSAHVTGVDGTTGIALAEIYDPAPAEGARLVGVSARAHVGTGANILIGGFVISGNLPKTVLIRAVGPSLAQFSIGGLLADPKLELYSGSTLLQTNDNWIGDTAVDQPAVVGGNATFSVAVADPSQVLYYWYRNGTLVPGADGRFSTSRN
jgi:hypothetical protein